MIAVRVPDRTQMTHLVEALLVAAGIVPPPTDPNQRQHYLDLANQLDHGLQRMPEPSGVIGYV